MSAPAPKPSTSPTTRSGHGRPRASTAPRTSDDAAIAPQNVAESMRGSVRSIPVDTEADFLTAARADPALAVLEGLHALKHALRFGAEVLRIAAPDPAATLALAARVAPDLELAGRIERAPLGRRAHHTGVAAIARRPPFDPAALPPAASSCSRTHATWATSARRSGSRPRPARPRCSPPAPPTRGIPPRSAARPGCTSRCRSGAPTRPATARCSRSTRPGRRPGRCRPEPRWPSARSATGSAPALLARADFRVRIPMRPGVSSLNLATAVAVALYMVRSGFSQRSIVDAGTMPTDS